MAPNPTIMQAVEQLGYRVTVGDIAAQSGLDVTLAQQGLLALATDAAGHLQVAESGDMVYLFPKNFRTVLRNKFLRLRLQEWWNKVWKVLFYLIRISFGVVLLLSIALIVLSIIIITILSLSDQNSSSSNNQSSSRSQDGFFPIFWSGSNWFGFFEPSYGTAQHRRHQRQHEPNQMNFLEAIFSFLFGDGNPNADLEDRRWQEIAHVIRHNQGAVVAEQIAPYLDNIGQGYSREYEDYMLPVLTRFNGQPAVSPDGQIVYHFPELQTLAQRRYAEAVPASLQELPWRFSAASSGQIMLAAGLGAFNFVGALVLGKLLANSTAASLGGLVGFVHAIFWLLLGYAVAFLTVPLVRYFWVQWRNRKIAASNEQRQKRAWQLEQAEPTLQQKIAYARQFAAETVVSDEDLAYTTETDLLEQEIRSGKIEAEWQRRLERGK